MKKDPENMARKLKDEEFDIVLKNEMEYSSIFTFLSDAGNNIWSEFQDRHELTEEQLKEVKDGHSCEIDGVGREVIEFPKFLSDADEIETLLERASDDPREVFWVEGVNRPGGTRIRVLAFEVVEGE